MANIDSMLYFLQNAKDGDAIAAREAIADALKEIYLDKQYPDKKIKITEDGEYESDEENPFTNVEIAVGPPLVSGFADRFKITKNGDYHSYDLFDKDDVIITEFDIEVPQTIREKKHITISENGEYEAGSDECYNSITVDITEAHHAGDLLKPSFYYNLPGDPNFDAKQYIFTDHDVLFGTRAGLIFRRLPKLDEITYNDKIYIQDGWNPGIDSYNGLTTDQQFNPTWNIAPYGYTRQTPKTVYFDGDVFAAVCYNKAIGFFIKPGETVIINGCNAKLRYIADEYAGINKTFWEWINVDELINVHYASNDALLNTRDTINANDDYYCWKHSLVRAFLNDNDEDLVINDDISAFNSLTSIKDIIGNELFDYIYPVAQYTNKIKKRDPNSKFYRYKMYQFWDSEYDIRECDNYYYIAPEDIPGGNPKQSGLYILTNNGVELTEDESVVADTNYYQKVLYSDPTEHGVTFYSPVGYNNFTGVYDNVIKNDDLIYEIGFSNASHTSRSIAGYIDNNKVYRFNIAGNGTIIKGSEYTFDNHLNYIAQHYSKWKKSNFVEDFTFKISVTFGKNDTAHFSPSQKEYVNPHDCGLYYVYDDHIPYPDQWTYKRTYDTTWKNTRYYKIITDPLPDPLPEIVDPEHRYNMAEADFSDYYVQVNPSTIIGIYDMTKLPDKNDDVHPNYRKDFETNNFDFLSEYEAFKVTDTVWDTDNPDKYRYMLIEVERWAETDLNNRFYVYNETNTSSDTSKFTYNIWSTSNIFQQLLWANHNVQNLYPGYEFKPLLDDYLAGNIYRWQTTRDYPNILRGEYTEPVTFLQKLHNTGYSPQTDYPHLDGLDIDTAQFNISITNNLFDEVDVYKDPNNPNRYFKKINIVASNHFDILVYNRYTYEYSRYPFLYYSGNYSYPDSMTIWDNAFYNKDPEDYRTEDLYLSLSGNIPDTFYSYDRMFPDPEDPESISGMYYFDQEKMDQYDEMEYSSSTSRNYIIYYLIAYKYVNYTYGEHYIYLYKETYEHRETRSSSSARWSVSYDDGAQNIYNSIKNETPVYNYILNNYPVGKMYESVNTYKEHNRVMPYAMPYVRQKIEDHGYIEDGDIWPNETYYATIHSTLSINNPFSIDEYTYYDNENYYVFDDLNKTGYVYSLYTVDKTVFYDINQIDNYYGEYNLYYYTLELEGTLSECVPKNNIYYAESDPIYLINEVECDCDHTTDKFLLSTDIWLDECCLYPSYGKGFKNDEIVINTETEYFQKNYLYDFFGIGIKPPKPNTKTINDTISQHVNPNTIYRYSGKQDYLHGHYQTKLDSFFLSKKSHPDEQYDHLMPTDTDASNIYNELGNEYDTVITQKKYELQGSFDASTGSSQIKHAYFFL